MALAAKVFVNTCPLLASTFLNCFIQLLFEEIGVVPQGRIGQSNGFDLGRTDCTRIQQCNGTMTLQYGFESIRETLKSSLAQSEH